jgi:TetR/AcrR family transcriptional regulator, repressor of fatR-cypB operon
LQSNNKQEKIIEAALILFADRGFHGTNVPAIAKLADVGTGTIYRYFKNKEELVNAVYQKAANQLHDSITLQFPVHESIFNQYQFIIRRFILFAKENKEAFIFIETHNHADYLDEISLLQMKRLEKFLCTFLRKGVEDAQLRNDIACEALIAIVYGAYVAIFKRIEAGVIQDTEELEEGFIQSGWDAIRARI